MVPGTYDMVPLQDFTGQGLNPKFWNQSNIGYGSIFIKKIHDIQI